jgi:hypothetical protein
MELSMAARNFGDVPIRTSLEKIAKIKSDIFDDFDWRDTTLFAEYKAHLKEFGPNSGY